MFLTLGATTVAIYLSHDMWWKPNHPHYTVPNALCDFVNWVIEIFAIANILLFQNVVDAEWSADQLYDSNNFILNAAMRYRCDNCAGEFPDQPCPTFWWQIIIYIYIYIYIYI